VCVPSGESRRSPDEDEVATSATITRNVVPRSGMSVVVVRAFIDRQPSFCLGGRIVLCSAPCTGTPAGFGEETSA